MKILFILLAVVFLGAGCTGQSESYETNAKQAISACLDKGGVPILSGLTGMLKVCQTL